MKPISSLIVFAGSRLALASVIVRSISSFASSLRVLTIFGLVLLSPAANAITLTANFDSVDRVAGVGSSYLEGGLQFTSPTSFGIAYGSFGATLFGWGGYTFVGSALYVHNNGWVEFSAPGYLMNSVSFSGGFDWNGYTIESGLMDVSFSYQALLNDTVVDSGTTTWGRENRVHAFGASIHPLNDFDTLLVRSTAVIYEGIYQPVPQPPGYWFYERGEVVQATDANHIAFDNVTVSATRVPETTSTLTLLVASIALLFAGWASARLRR